VHGLGPTELRRLVHFLHSNETISQLHLGDNDWPGEATKIQSKYLGINLNTKHKDNQLNRKVLRKLSALLQVTKSIAELGLGSTRIGGVELKSKFDWFWGGGW